MKLRWVLDLNFNLIKPITEKEVNEIIEDIICKTLKINTVKIPGL